MYSKSAGKNFSSGKDGLLKTLVSVFRKRNRYYSIVSEIYPTFVENKSILCVFTTVLIFSGFVVTVLYSESLYADATGLVP
ncbi:MAG: hypothetical protein LBK82_02735 [Planctomycetaceae bacterium]|jgi:hypothetical protein|nr:hypothetical protein [Planctomycetaceae bacterium]